MYCRFSFSALPGWLDVSHESRHVLIMNAIAEAPASELDVMIARSPGVLGGKPCVRGHRVAVHRVAGWWKLGLTVEEIGERVPSLTPAEVHVALAYYHLHQQEIEGYLEGERAACRGLERKPTLPA